MSVKSRGVLIPSAVAMVLKKQKYQLVGRHSAVKRCHWFYKALTGRGHCYKQEWYNIRSHRCLQMTPCAVFCTNRCLPCWRLEPGDLGFEWDQMAILREDVDEPEEIVEECIRAQRRILTGFNPAHHQLVSEEKWREALEPKHAAISLAGEPTLYSELGGLIEAFHRRGMTTFLVTNGVVPERLEEIEEPTQLYLTLYAPSEDVYKQVCRPLLKDAWSRVVESLSLLRSFSCPTVVRLTLVKGLNFMEPEKYAELIKLAEPTYVECKSYVSVGMSLRRGLNNSNMVGVGELRLFAEKIGEELGYNIIGESVSSRVILLSKLSKPIKVA
ncbi:MAG: 4-demethylwyosine synthase TYW1 [Candidatus Jordarchaeales archaeon]